MIDFDKVRETIASGLKDYLSCKVVRGNQTAQMPKYPFCSYNITTLANENNGTYAEWEDGVKRKPYVMTMSITVHSDNYSETVNLASKAHEWLDYVGTTYLNDNDIIIQSVGSVTDRSNLISMEYEYTYGFDCFIWLYDEITTERNEDGEIKTSKITQVEYE